MTASTSGPDAAVVGRRGLFLLGGLVSASLLSACGDDDGAPPSPTTGGRKGTTAGSMTVYKDASCGCCDGWVEHAEEHGYSITTEHPAALTEVWQRHDVPAEMQSCHLALDTDGNVFVGHVPIRFVRDYLADPPEGSRGLSVPAMPVGTPGMEQGEQFDPYDVMLLGAGEPSVFRSVTARSQQRA